MEAVRPFTVVVRCADPRVDVFFRDPALRESMALAAEPIPLAEAHIANVGGLLSLAGAEAPRLVHDVSLLLHLFAEGRGRAVLTAHSTCGGYLDAVEGDADAVRRRQTEDLIATAHRLAAALPDLEISVYYLDLAGERIIEIDA